MNISRAERRVRRLTRPLLRGTVMLPVSSGASRNSGYLLPAIAYLTLCENNTFPFPAVTDPHETRRACFAALGVTRNLIDDSAFVHGDDERKCRLIPPRAAPRRERR